MAAIREVAEETGLRVTLGAPLPTQTYAVDARSKQVRYWRSASVSGEFTPNDEVDELRWLAADAAKGLLTYGHDQSVIDAALNDGMDMCVPLVVVRHAHAGDSAAWVRAGRDDVLRPLSDLGSSQVPVITATALAYGVTQVMTSHAQRCTMTVADLTATLGSLVETALYDGSDIGSAQFMSALFAVVDQGRPAVVCTHGEQVDWLTSTSGATKKFRKGGVCIAWVNSETMREGALRAMGLDAQAWEYYDTYPQTLGV